MPLLLLQPIRSQAAGDARVFYRAPAVGILLNLSERLVQAQQHLPLVVTVPSADGWIRSLTASPISVSSFSSASIDSPFLPLVPSNLAEGG